MTLQEKINWLMGVRFEDTREIAKDDHPSEIVCQVPNCNDRGNYKNCYDKKKMRKCHKYIIYRCQELDKT